MSVMEKKTTWKNSSSAITCTYEWLHRTACAESVNKFNYFFFFFVIITVLYLQGVFMVLAKNIKFFSCPFSFTERVLPETAPKTMQIKIKFETPQAFFEEGKIYFKHCSFSGFSH